MLYKVLTKISYFDRFQAEVKLNSRKKETHQSPFGGFCTILLVLVLTVIFIRGVIGLIKKETFTISSTKILNVNPPITQIQFYDLSDSISSRKSYWKWNQNISQSHIYLKYVNDE
ncbi:unnamed protein product [Paramecium primaurelia]|uniref:Uncharacterized protein n=1 Tax=Paramecium primaurelia TaxID=5886 RepID=A0A8S1N1H6_PARPR|nr:unnamed protein product [Paramecium primaurelia]